MTSYRSLTTIQAVQYAGEPLPGITCEGSDQEMKDNGCDSSRRQLRHVHANVTGGMVVLKPGDFIFPMPGGPWGVSSDERFQASWEVPAPAPAPAVVPTAVLEPLPPRQPVTIDTFPTQPLPGATTGSTGVASADAVTVTTTTETN